MVNWLPTWMLRQLNGKEESLQGMMVGQIDIHMQKNEAVAFLHQTHTTKWYKMIADLNIRSKIIKFLEIQNIRAKIIYTFMGEGDN